LEEESKVAVPVFSLGDVVGISEGAKDVDVNGSVGSKENALVDEITGLRPTSPSNIALTIEHEMRNTAIERIKIGVRLRCFMTLITSLQYSEIQLPPVICRFI